MLTADPATSHRLRLSKSPGIAGQCLSRFDQTPSQHEGFEEGFVVFQDRRELPRKGPGSGPSSKRPCAKIFVGALSRITQPEDMGHLASALDREDEVVRCLSLPLREMSGALQRMEGTGEFDRRKFRRGELEFGPLSKVRRIESLAPRRIAPARDADSDPCRLFSCRTHAGPQRGSAATSASPCRIRTAHRSGCRA